MGPLETHGPTPPPNIPHVSLGIRRPKTRHYTDEELFFVPPGFQVSAQKQPRADVGRPSGFPKHMNGSRKSLRSAHKASL